MKQRFLSPFRLPFSKHLSPFAAATTTVRTPPRQWPLSLCKGIRRVDTRERRYRKRERRYANGHCRYASGKRYVDERERRYANGRCRDATGMSKFVVGQCRWAHGMSKFVGLQSRCASGMIHVDTCESRVDRCKSCVHGRKNYRNSCMCILPAKQNCLGAGN